ncbi:MAG: efflux RND transporter permease subunit, partial [Phycisphaerales bacterium]
QKQIYEALAAKNLVADAGHVGVGSDWLPIQPTGDIKSAEALADLLISEPGAPQLIYLGDVAEIRRAYADPPDAILEFTEKRVFRDGQEIQGIELESIDPSDPSLDIQTGGRRVAIGFAISTVTGGNVVTMGDAVKRRLKELEPLTPVGMDINVVSLQSDSVTKAIRGFVVSLGQAVAIVVIVLLVFMGIRSGVLIGLILFLTIVASFIIMKAQGIVLQRISLGALIIALGMLVDNAIVVTDGMRIKIQAGVDKLKAAREVVSQNQMPLLGATFVAVLAFAAIGLSEDSTGEYCSSLFYVLLISLLTSWLTAVTVTPLLCIMFFKPKAGSAGGEAADPYGGLIYRFYRWLLETAIRLRWVTLAVVIGLFCLALYGFGSVKKSFFPDSTRPQFLVDIWMPQGTRIDDVRQIAAQTSDYVMSLDNTLSVASHVGNGAPRFLLTYSPEQPNSAYAQLIVSVFDYRRIEEMRKQVQGWMDENLLDALTYTNAFRLGPATGGKIQLRFSGPDGVVLRRLADEAMEIMYEDGNAQGIRHDWRQRELAVKPLLAEAQASRRGITRKDVASRLKSAFEGANVGVYREGTEATEDRVIPIISRSPEDERADVGNINDLQIYSPAAGRMVPVRQVLIGVTTVFQDPIIRRRDRSPTITIHCDQRSGEASVLFSRIKPLIEEKATVDVGAVLGRPVRGEFTASTLPVKDSNPMPLKDYPGFYLAWGGEAEDSARAAAGLASSIPMFAVMMVLITVMLFNNLRQPLIIWLTVPLALIGVTAGLLMFDQPFGFMAILGALSLSGMLIKNAVVLLDQMNINLRDGMSPYDAIVSSGVSRMMPVLMAAATTVLGMLPLVPDAFFVSMAVAIMFGLSFATLLTLLVVPTLCAVFYRVRSPG